jgi:hypothetical protein
VERWWNDTDRAKQKYWDRNTLQNCFVHHKPNTDWPGIGPTVSRPVTAPKLNAKCHVFLIISCFSSFPKLHISFSPSYYRPLAVFQYQLSVSARICGSILFLTDFLCNILSTRPVSVFLFIMHVTRLVVMREGRKEEVTV